RSAAVVPVGKHDDDRADETEGRHRDAQPLIKELRVTIPKRLVKRPFGLLMTYLVNDDREEEVVDHRGQRSEELPRLPEVVELRAPVEHECTENPHHEEPYQ